MDKRIGVIDALSTRLAAGLLLENELSPHHAHEDLLRPKPCFDLREQSLLTHMCWNSALIHGHFLWSDRAFDHFADKYQFVTLLRNPIDRAISNINMNMKNGIVPINLSVDEWLEGRLGFHHASTFLRYFSGQATIERSEAKEYLEIAKANARRFSLIGSVENTSWFVGRFTHKFGAKLQIGRLNEGTHGGFKLSQIQYVKLRELCEFDLALYTEFQKWDR